MTTLPLIPVTWFEIPVNDMERAITFYTAVFGYGLKRINAGPLDMAYFDQPDIDNGTSGSLVKHEEFFKPSPDGVVIYFASPSGDLQNELDKVEKAGGTIRVQKKLISPDFGYMAAFIDSEGNRIALRSMK